MSNIDLNNITEVKATQTRSQSYDLKYNTQYKRFSVSKSFYTENNMSEYGFKLYQTVVDGDPVLLLGKVSNEEASFYRGREGKEKLNIFFNNAFSQSLLGLTSLNDESNASISMRLTPVPNNNDLELFEVIITAIDVKEEEAATLTA
jgi:hypothetical protein